MSRDSTARSKSLAKAALAKSNRSIIVSAGGLTDNSQRIASIASSLGISFSSNTVSSNQTNLDIQSNTDNINLLSTATTKINNKIDAISAVLGLTFNPDGTLDTEIYSTHAHDYDDDNGTAVVTKATTGIN